ncbi:aldehyde dehydrogenase family 3 member B1 isoform X2 [Zootoca vivipara]|uniref:aldehyde dehydrogenase family 3 member B1 isoform X2 n=1 Tax=Zootoca vivipara TaxID=8524 RepID=UPI00293C0E57|nr:aldehyde dehydrogenase family 3 member B1 isoform X2 [Zootoca vivipara]
MERAGEIVQSVFSGQWDLRQQRKVTEITKQIEGMQSTEGAGAQPQQHKFQEIPLQSDAGQAGSSGASGQQWGFPRQSKSSGSSGQPGSSGSSGQQRGSSGQAGSSGSSGQQWGFPGQSKSSGSSGQPGSSGSSGEQRGSMGQAGSSDSSGRGSSGQAGSSGSSGRGSSGQTGSSDSSGRGSSGQAGSSGSSCQAGNSGSSGRGSSGQAGSSGSSGQGSSGQAGSSGSSGRGSSGQAGSSGSSCQAGSSGSSGRGSSGQAGSSGSSGQAGSSGSSGRGSSGQAGSSGSSGRGSSGQAGSSGSSGQAGSSGSSGRGSSGQAGSSDSSGRGSSGQAGSSGSSGQAGSSGSSGRGSSGQAGSSDSSGRGSSGQAGSSGSSGRGSSGQAGSSSGQQQQQKIQDLPSPSQDNKGGELSRMNPYAGLVDCLRATWLTGKTRPMEYRKGQLEALNRFLEERRSDLLHALNQDMRRPHFEGDVAEVAFTRSEVNNALNNLCCWMKDENVSKNLATQLDCAFIRKDPYGVAVIIAPYNYPIHLLLVPLVGAIAAGNCVIVKPAELARHTERLLAEALPCYLDPETFAVVTGGTEEVTKLLENQFDYIFFTGSPRVGKIIMTAAAKHLTPLTLELGGKNPCYVDKCCNFQNAANRIVWGKFFNAGQTCIAPDYVICTIETQERLMPCLRQAIREFYGECPQDSPDFGRLIDDKHFRRLRAFLECGRVAIGGESDESDRYIAPTVLADVKEWEPIMQEEVFGPILPIFTVGDLDEAIHYINRKQRPLVAYAFSCDCKVVNRVLDCTSSGNFCGNDTIIYSTLVSLPFGGIGYSGLGKYHGKFSFDTFTHQRGCLLRCMGMEAINTIRYPPYTESKLQLLVSVLEVKRKGMCTLL